MPREQKKNIKKYCFVKISFLHLFSCFQSNASLKLLQFVKVLVKFQGKALVCIFKGE